MKKDDSVYLRHMLDAISRVGTYLDEVTEQDFHANHLVQDAVIRQVEVIGEAARRVSAEVRAAWPGTPWVDIAAMRNKLIHDYFGVDIEKVWLTATEDLPQLETQLREILRDMHMEQ